MEEQSQPSTASLILGSGALKPAITTAESMRKAAPNDARALRRLGTLYRQLGELDRAANVFAELVALDPQNQEAVYLHDLFTGRPGNRSAKEWPPNFLISRDHLPPEEYQRIRDSLEPAAHNMTAVRVHSRTPRSDYVGTLGSVEEWFRRHILRQLESWCEALGVLPFDAEVRGIHFTRYANGEFYPVHNDGLSGKGHLLEVIYFVDFVPNTFHGGELILFDDRGEGSKTCAWTAIPPSPNTLVVFPSTHFHEIATVRCESPEMLAGRFMLAAWLRATPAS